MFRIDNKMKKSIFLIVAFLGVIFVSASSSYAESDTLKRLKKQGYATVAVANEPPYSDIKPDGFVGGAAPDIARAVLNKLGVTNQKSEPFHLGRNIYLSKNEIKFVKDELKKKQEKGKNSAKNDSSKQNKEESEQQKSKNEERDDQQEPNQNETSPSANEPSESAKTTPQEVSEEEADQLLGNLSEELKTFDRYDISYTIYFNKISI